MDGRFMFAILIGIAIGFTLTIIFACLSLESKLDQEEEKREHELHMRR